MKDKIAAGAFAGIIGALVVTIYDLLFITLFLHQKQGFIYFNKRLIMYDEFYGPIAYIVGLVCHTSLGAMYGIILSYLISKSSESYYLFKGWGIGMGVWIYNIAFTTFFRMPGFVHIKPLPALTHIIGTSIFGITTVYALKLLTHNFEGITEKPPVKKEVVNLEVEKPSLWQRIFKKVR